MSGWRFAVILVVAACPLFSQEDSDFYRKGNVNIGGGFATPLHPTSRYAAVSGNFVVGGGYDFSRRHSIVGEFMWAGLRPDPFALRPLVNPLIAGSTSDLGASSNLYAVTANYMFRLEKYRFGAYIIGGGGWYYRYAKLTRAVVQPETACSINLLYWGYTCVAGYVETDETLISAGSTALGGNVGVGITIKVADSGEKFYIESRYHYAPHRNVSTHVLPVTFGFRW
jgi:hypothetical protein